MPKKLTTEEYITKAKQVHLDKYTYEKTIYTLNKRKVVITCRIHGDFEQTASHHTVGHGCPQCAKIEVANVLKIKNASTIQEFIGKANKIHNNKFDYKKSIYTNNKTKITITCPIHGDFEQTPNDHLDGCGCPQCKYAEIRQFWSYTDWENAGVNSKNFNGYSLYIIKCFNQTEEFIKIGKTFQDINKRFQKGVKMPYEWELIKLIKASAKEISDLERLLHTKFKNYSYLPTIKFGGAFECFSTTVLQKIQQQKDLLNEPTI